MAARVRRPTDEQATAIRDPRAPQLDERIGVRAAEAAPEPTEAEPSAPIHVISMKDRVAAEQRHARDQRAPLHVQLRSIAEVRRHQDTPPSASRLGRLAPPRDPREVRARRWRANVMWGCVAIVLACGISLVVWFAAGR